MKKFMILPLLLAMGLAQAAVYTWKDANGNTVYSDHRPAPGAHSGQVREFTGKPLSTISAPKAASAPLGKGSLLKTEQKLAEDDTQRKLVAQQRNEKCLQARGNQKVVQDGGRVTFVDKEGKQQYMDDKNRVALLQEAAENVAYWCK